MYTSKPQILIALGSPSDITLFPELAALVQDGKTKPSSESAGTISRGNAEYMLSVASAHRTPELLEAHARHTIWDVIIAGAGLTNALVSRYLTLVSPKTIVIGLPIYDKLTGGLTSLLSSQELPPGIVAGTVGINQCTSAVEAAEHIVTTPYDRVAVVHNKIPLAGQVASTLEQLGVPYRLSDGDIRTGEVAAVVCSKTNSANPINSSSKFCVRMYEGQPLDYMENGVPSKSLVVGFGAGANLAYFVAKIVARQNSAVGDALCAAERKSREKYMPWKNIVRLNGNQ